MGCAAGIGASRESLKHARVEDVAEALGHLSPDEFQTLANAVDLQRKKGEALNSQEKTAQEPAQPAVRKGVRKVDFRVPEGMPTVPDHEVAVWATEVRGGMMNGAIPQNSMVGQKVKAAHDYFVHFCKGDGKQDVIQTITGSAEHVVYLHRQRGASGYKEDVIVHHDDDGGATFLTFQNGFDVGSGAHIPIGKAYMEEDKEDTVKEHPERGCWGNPEVSLGAHRKTDKGIDWGCSQYGHVYTKKECRTLVIEIPWPGSPANIRRRAWGMLDNIQHQQREFAKLQDVVSSRQGLACITKDLREPLERFLEEQTSILTELVCLLSEGEQSTLTELAGNVADLLDGMLKEVEDRFIEETAALPPGAKLVFHLLENTDLTLEPCRGFDTITRAWIGDRDAIWGDEGKDVTKVVEEMLQRGSLHFGEQEAMILTGKLYTDHPNWIGKRRALAVEVSAAGLALRCGEDVRLLLLRSIVYEELAVQRKEKKLRKTMHGMLLELQGDAEELVQLKEMTSDSNDPLKRELQTLADDVKSAMDQLDAQKDMLLNMDKLYREADFRQAVSKLKAFQASEFKRLDTLKKSLEARLLRLQDSAGKTEKVAARMTAQKDKVASDLCKNGFSLRQLLTFVNEKSLSGHIKEDTTTAQIVCDVVIPETKDRACCYAQILPGGAKKPQTLMSHWWGNVFLNLVRAICEHASGRADLSLGAHIDGDLDKTYWLCIFGVNQHFAICHTRPTACTCGRPKVKAARMKCQMDKFGRVMGAIPCHALALDPRLTTLTRVWVLAELDEAMTGRVKKNTLYCGTVDSAVQRNPHIPSVLDAHASFPEDKELIVGAIQARENGVEEFDKNMSSQCLGRISILSMFQAAQDNDVDILKREVDARPELINQNRNTGIGETVLQVAARLGATEIVHFLVQQEGIDVNGRSRFLGWTALHFAAICWNPHQAEGVLRVLLSAKADPELENHFGRTPFEEALCGASNPNVIEVLGDQTKRQPDPCYMDRFINAMEMMATGNLKDFNVFKTGKGFLPHLMDAQLFGHGASRLGSYRCSINLQLSLTDDGELNVVSHWNPPFAFDENDATPMPVGNIPTLMMLYKGALRLGEYAKYRYPGWTFHRIAISHCGHIYRFDLKAATLTAMKPSMRDAEGIGKTAGTWYNFGAQFLYP